MCLPILSGYAGRDVGGSEFSCPANYSTTLYFLLSIDVIVNCVSMQEDFNNLYATSAACKSYFTNIKANIRINHNIIQIRDVGL